MTKEPGNIWFGCTAGECTVGADGQVCNQPMQVMWYKKLCERLGKAIDLIRHEVSTRNWRIFWRIVVDGQPAVDVAEEFSVTANAVRLVKMRVLRRLRDCLEDKNEPLKT